MAIEPISQFFSALGRYPGNNKQWWVAKAGADEPGPPPVSAGDFLPLVLDKVYSGNNKAPRGHFILNAFNKDRSAVSGIADIPSVDTGVRPNTTCFFSGRAWFAANSEVYYSQIIDDKSKAGLCFQEADPTSEDISDLIASDGGNIPIPEANKIVKILAFSSGVFVFATNGVWFIGGGNSGFSATDIQITKVSPYGTTNPDAIVQVSESVLWWSEIGIQALEQASGQFGPIPGKFGNTNIAEQTIQSFYNSIPENSKAFAKSQYDPKNNIVQWLYSDDNDNPKKYNRILIYDVTLQAFYPWKVSQEEDSPELIGLFLDTDYLKETSLDTVVSNLGIVTDLTLDNVDVEVTSSSIATRPTNLTYVTKVGANNITFSKFNNRNMVDWASFDGVGLTYDSFIETGFELSNDAMRRKQTVYVTVFFRRTEDDSQGVPSSCRFKAKWDWAANSNSNKWSTEVEAYRPRINLATSSSQDLEGGMPVVFSKNKVRGSGKAVQFRFGNSLAESNFDLLGWAVTYAGNTDA
jgi:hypothetical protein